MNRQRNIPNKNSIVRQPRWVFLTGMLITLILGTAIIIMTLFPNDTITWWVYLFVYGFLFVGLWYLWMWAIWKITIMRVTFQYRNSFGQTRKIPFSDIKKVQMWQQPRVAIRLISKNDQKTLSLTDDYRGFKIFMDCLEKHSIRIENM